MPGAKSAAGPTVDAARAASGSVSRDSVMEGVIEGVLDNLTFLAPA